ncbi:hypothetical protein PCE1_002954 [Barthelona sp. PCE]
MTSFLAFNSNFGMLEALVRGYYTELLKPYEYSSLQQCETLEDLRLQLCSSSYATILQSAPSNLTILDIRSICRQQLVNEFNHLYLQSPEPMKTFMDYIKYGYMIDNVVLMISGSLKNYNTQKLLKDAHPLGLFPALSTLSLMTSPREIYRLVLIDTPLSEFFVDCLDLEDLDDMHIEIMRALLQKKYLEKFYEFVQTLKGASKPTMMSILEFLADRRAITLTFNALHTDLSKDQRKKLYPNFGKLYPFFTKRLSNVSNADDIKSILRGVVPYRRILEFVETDGLEEAFDVAEMEVLRLSMLHQYSFAPFFVWIKMKEQEMKNITYIADCIALKKKPKNYVITATH